MKNISALICGLLFGFGLAISGMTDTQKVIGFLNILGDWDPDLAFVMGGAVVTSAIGFMMVFRFRKKPLFNSDFLVPLKQIIDKN